MLKLYYNEIFNSVQIKPTIQPNLISLWAKAHRKRPSHNIFGAFIVIVINLSVTICERIIFEMQKKNFSNSNINKELR